MCTDRYQLSHKLKLLYAKYISVFTREDKDTIEKIIDLIDSYLDFK